METNFVIANTTKLQLAINSTSVSKSQIASAGKLSLETLNRALKGNKISRHRANGIIDGLNKNGCTYSLSDLFDELTE